MSRTAPDAQPPVAILYQSTTILAVDKPSGLIVHSDGTGARTLTDIVRDELASSPNKAAQQAACELQALNRLDRDTSGIVLFSCSKATQARYDHLIEAHEFTKRYLAVIVGRPAWRERTFTGPIGRDRHDARRMRVSRTGKPATTHARVVDSVTRQGVAYTLLAIVIDTGRKHQIRVHLAEAGYPLVGDTLYGPNTRNNQARGLMLHACELACTDPITGRAVRITAPAPARMRALFPSLT